MIDAKELRIGNWVNGLIKNEDGGDITSRIPIKVSLHHLSKIIECGNKAGEYFAPIPLMPEILLACGFEGDVGYFTNSKYHDFKLWYDTGTGEFQYTKPSGLYIVVEYLHQLQNLFYSLEQDELQIKLTQKAST